jgi:hypothetical protein
MSKHRVATDGRVVTDNAVTGRVQAAGKLVVFTSPA